MRTDNCCIAVLVAFALRSESPFSLRHPSFEAEGIPLMLSPGGAFKSHQAEIEAGVFLLTHVDAVLHVLTVKHAIINPFLSTYDDKMAGQHQEEELDIKAWARGLHPASEGLSPIKDGAGGQGSQSSWVEYWLDRDCPVNKGCSIDPCSTRHASTY